MPKNIPAAVVHVPLKTRFAYPRAQLLIIVTPGLKGYTVQAALWSRHSSYIILTELEQVNEYPKCTSATTQICRFHIGHRSLSISEPKIAYIWVSDTFAYRSPP